MRYCRMFRFQSSGLKYLFCSLLYFSITIGCSAQTVVSIGGVNILYQRLRNPVQISHPIYPFKTLKLLSKDHSIRIEKHQDKFVIIPADTGLKELKLYSGEKLIQKIYFNVILPNTVSVKLDCDSIYGSEVSAHYLKRKCHKLVSHFKGNTSWMETVYRDSLKILQYDLVYIPRRGDFSLKTIKADTIPSYFLWMFHPTDKVVIQNIHCRIGSELIIKAEALVLDILDHNPSVYQAPFTELKFTRLLVNSNLEDYIIGGIKDTVSLSEFDPSYNRNKTWSLYFSNYPGSYRLNKKFIYDSLGLYQIQVYYGYENADYTVTRLSDSFYLYEGFYELLLMDSGRILSPAVERNYSLQNWIPDFIDTLGLEAKFSYWLGQIGGIPVGEFRVSGAQRSESSVRFRFKILDKPSQMRTLVQRDSLPRKVHPVVLDGVTRIYKEDRTLMNLYFAEGRLVRVEDFRKEDEQL